MIKFFLKKFRGKKFLDGILTEKVYLLSCTIEQLPWVITVSKILHPLVESFSLISSTKRLIVT